MKFSVVIVGPTGQDQSIGTIDVNEDVYIDDDALVAALAQSGYVDVNEVLDLSVIEEDDGRVDIFEYETGSHRVSLVLIH